MNILVVTLGVSWAVAPELLAYVNLDSFPLYDQHPRRAVLREALRVQKVEPVEELWIVTTCDARTLDGVMQLRCWLEASVADVRLRVWYSQTVSELNDAAQCRHMRDLILRVVLHARQWCESGQLVLSLAGGLTEMAVSRILESELTCPDVQCALIFIASRHGPPAEIQRHVALARQLVHPDAFRSVPLVGFDLAGNESIRSARDLRDMFMPLMEKCIHLTIHAGETEDVRSIWEALYHLNAERIGHGLKLRQQPDLLAHCLDRRVTLELCPSSNRQIVGFYENHETPRAASATYPLGDYLRRGLRVTVNTDNPGISRTNLTHEFYRAACLTPGGLTQWELLQLVRNSFRSAFVAHPARKQLLLKAESEICAFLTQAL